MQQRGSNTTMEPEESENSSNPPSRSRPNTKLKVLVRSHAMREETSPPRETPPPQQPRIELMSSPETESADDGGISPAVLLSPSAASTPTRRHSPDQSSGVTTTSTTTTLIPPTCSPLIDDGREEDHVHEISSPKYTNKLNSRNLDLPKQSSHNSFRKKCPCECLDQACLKCLRTVERNINNNSTSTINNNMTGSNPNMLTVSRARGKLRQQSSSLGSFESSSNSPCLSRDSSSEQYTDTTGVDLEQFIPETLNRNAKDRALMLRIEQELVSLAKDRCKTHYKFPPMSSYQRMLVHRCAAYFGMEHNVEPTGKSVVVGKTKNTRIPENGFKEYVREDAVFAEEPRRSILKRDSNGTEDYSFKSPDRSCSLENRRSKSFEEREEEYEKARRRIFNRELHDGSSEDFEWSEIPWSSTESDYSARFRLQPPDCHRRQLGKLIKVHSEDTGEALRPYVAAKSYSFGGYGGSVSVLSRGDSVMSTHSAGPRLLTKQVPAARVSDSGASSVSWRLSPSSSGYKSQSQMSESATPSPTSTPHPICQEPNSGNESEVRRRENADNHIVWAVTDMQNVPKGSIIIDPQTGKPLKNDDGSLYYYDPTNLLPALVQPVNKPPPSPPKTSPKEDPPSPKKTRSSKLSPSRKSNLTNSSTSPSLPFTPPPQQTPAAATSTHQRSFSYAHVEGVPGPPPPQQFGSYTPYMPTPTAGEGGGTTTAYQQPYVVYTAPYGVHMTQQYDGRMDAPSVPDVTGTYYIQESSGPPQPPTITYQHAQPSPYWNQPLAFYQNSSQTASATPPQRFTQGPMPPQAQPGFLPGGYQPTYVPPPAVQAPQNPPELVPIYPGHQQMQVLYQGQPQPPPPPPNPVMYHGQPPLIYTQNPVYPQHYPPQSQMPAQMGGQPIQHYPQSTPTPNSCTSSSSGPIFPGGMGPPDPQTFMQLTQSIQQMNLGGQTPPHGFVNNKGQPFDFRHRPVNCFAKGGGGVCNKYPNKQGAFTVTMGCSSQSSTGTSSPAATVIAAAAATAYCPHPQQQPYRTPPETPPAHFTAFAPNFSMPPPPPPIMFKQMGNVRVATPGTARSSRSPTPAGDVSFFERQRMSLPPNIYQGMPYLVSSDPRFFPAKGPPNMYRQAAPVNKPFNQGSDNRSHKNRKSKVNKQSGLPPSGK